MSTVRRREVRILVAVFVVAMVAAMVAPALAQQGPEVQVTDSQDRADQPDVAIDSNGNIHIAYSDESGTVRREIWYTMLDNDGNTLIDDTRLTADDIINSTRPAILVDSDDKVHIVWRDERWDGGNSKEVTYTKLDPSLDDQDGDAADEPTITVVDDTRLSDIGDWYFFQVRMAIDSNDDIHIVWDDNDADVIYYMKIDEDGNELVAETVIRSGNQSRALPDVAVDSNDNVHVVWSDQGTATPEQDPASMTLSKTYDEVYYMMLDNSGNAMIDATRLTPDNDDYCSKRPRIVVDSEGKVHITFHYSLCQGGDDELRTSPSKNVAQNWELSLDDFHELYYTKLDPSQDDQDGDAANEPTITQIDDTALTPDDGNYSALQAMAIGCGGYTHITWWEYDTDNNIHYMVLDTAGNEVVADTALSTAGTVASSTNVEWTIPYLAVDANGKVHVVWCDDRTGDYEVWYSSYDGPPCAPPEPVGGVIVPVNKLGLLAPWLGLAGLAGFAALGVALVRRRRG